MFEDDDDESLDEHFRMYCRGCWRSPETGMRQKMRDGLEQQSQLEDTASQLQRLVAQAQGNDIAADLQAQVERLQTIANGFKEHFSSCLDNSFYNERLGRSREATERFFDVPELIEYVMRYLPLDDLMRVQQVSKQLKAVTEGSPRATQVHAAAGRPGWLLPNPLRYRRPLV